ncbi:MULTISPECIES: prephenate dehydratase domain-containing protein [unclassified Streptomyces]|uniref:prephenate dehydratase domain-containing protein n=1 Tax=unclassified Streptomyces TaxID=2593676 RepID=UPI003808F314
MIQTVSWLRPSFATRCDSPIIATLGPSGTSSEVAAEVVWNSLDHDTKSARNIKLHRTYEDAAAVLLNSDVGYLVVANAYSGINEFYMDTRLTLAGTFVMDTPHYGIVRIPGRPVPDSPEIATHPAPRALVDQLLPTRFTEPSIVQVTSTSAAAQAVLDGVTDLALTTAPSAELHGLEFISRKRVIRMLWSVFISSEFTTVRPSSDSIEAERIIHAHT